MRRGFEQQRDEYLDGVAQMEEYLEMLELVEKLTKRCEKLEENVELWQKQSADKNQLYMDEKERRQDVEMKLAEMTKLSASIAKKASDEALRNALRIYANTSKRKTVDKRIFAKTAILEMANANGLTLPQEFAASIESLDDEQTEPRVVNVTGNYNDIHENGEVMVKG